MTTFLLLCLLLFGSMNSSESPRICFKEASSREFAEIQQHLILFYSEQLCHAGLFKDLDKATEAALIEWNQDLADHPNRALYCYHLVSKDSLIRYGYLVYSIQERVAYLDAIYLEKTHRGQGFGKQILQDFEIELKKKNVDTIKLYVFAHNIAALKLYNAMGYLIETTYSDAEKIIGHHMKKTI